MKSSLARRLPEKLFAPTDVASLVVFRICFGALMLWEVWRHLDGDWIEQHLLEPDFHFTYLGFTYVFLLEQALYLNHYYLISIISPRGPEPGGTGVSTCEPTSRLR